MTTLSRTTSYIGQMQERLEKIATEQMATLNARSLKAMIAWMETRQLAVAMETSVEDDALASAKLRGQVELLTEMGAHLTGLLGQIGKKPEQEPEESEE